MSGSQMVSRPPLVGRDTEFSQLVDLLAATAAGAGDCVVITGPAGIGKTRLLEEIVSAATGMDLAVACGSAMEIDRVEPGTTLHSALANRKPQPMDIGHSSNLDQLATALESAVSEQPLLIIIDDAQWMDEWSAFALRMLVAELSSAPVLWLLSRRPAPSDTEAQRAVDWLVGAGATALTLGPLDAATVRQLCREVLGAEPDATVLELAARGKGNPFLLEQLLTALSSTNQIMVSAGTATVIGDDLPASFHSAVEQRLRLLAEPARQLLRAGAIYGRPFTLHAAAGLLNMAVTELLGPAEEAVAAGLLVEDGPTVYFGHDLLRQAIYHGMPVPVRAALHREAARVIRAERGSIVEVAEYLVRGDVIGEPWEIDALRQAASEVAARAPGTAAGFVMCALAHVGEDDPRHAALSAEAVGLLASAGRLKEARVLGETALRQGLDPATEATLLLGLAEALKHSGQNRLAVHYAHRALDSPAVPESIQAGLHAIAAHALLYVDDEMAAADVAGAKAGELGARTAEHPAAVFGTVARSVVARADGRLDDALRHAVAAVDIADRERGEALHRHPRIWLGGALTALDRFADAEAAYAAGRREAERLGTAWSQPLWHFYNATLLTAKGWLVDATAEAEAGLQIAKRLSALQLGVPLLGLLARVATLRGQLSAARDHLWEMRRLGNDGITAAPEDVSWPIASFHQAEGDPLLADRALGELYDRMPGRLLLISNDPGCAAELVRIAIDAGAPDHARAAVSAAEALAARNPSVASLAGAAAHARGLLTGDIGALRAAVGHFERSPRPLARAGALEDLAVAERAGDPARAVDLLRAALSEAQNCGAGRAVQRLDKRLKAFGASVRQPRQHYATSLTAAERGVTDLVVEGMTNREIADVLQISPHTVDSHIRHIFAKYGVKSRRAVIRMELGEG